jgi:hypothetical protein
MSALLDGPRADTARAARRAAAARAVREGRPADDLWYAELADAEGVRWADDLVAAAMTDRDLTLAGAYAATFARVRWGTDRAPEVPPSAGKLRHDADQLDWLRERGLAGPGYRAVAARYREVAGRLAAAHGDDRVPMDESTRGALDASWGRLLHVRHSPRLPRALSGAWDPRAVEEEYLGRPPGVVVVDDFLSAEALAELRLFCHESTIWHANRYRHGRLGAFFRDGFNSPLLLQIAEELRAALPAVIGDRYPLRQMWGFKNAPSVPPESSVHADFAAVNVNFWITPTEANLDPATGGFVVYEADAPPGWDFYTYNGRADLIYEYLRQQQARRVVIPYRANRAVIFNSDLFHETAEVRFGPYYEDRRVNVTMLYGHREQDGVRAARPAQSWRSASLRRAR